MKKCPKCGRTYAEKDLNFCYDDGELLSYMAEETPTRAYSDRPSKLDEPPPTEFMGSPRVTDLTSWTPPQSPPARWQDAKPDVPFSAYPTHVSPNQTLAIVSLALGAGAVTVGWCCSSGFVLSPAALITGFIALSQIKKDPARYSGRGFALAGIIAAGVFIVLYLAIILVYVLMAMLSSMS